MVSTLRASFALLLVAATPLPAHAEEAAMAQARQLYQEGEKAFATGHFAEAADLFEKSYTIAPSARPELLWNIGNSWEKQYGLDVVAFRTVDETFNNASTQVEADVVFCVIQP